MLNDSDRDEINELIAQKMDIMSAFRDLPEAARESIANDIGPYIYSRQQSVRKPENFYTPRWTKGMANINEDDAGIEKGHAGPTMPRWVDIIGGTAYLDADDPQILHFTAGGGADCMFDYLVSQCWAAEVAAGRGTEGQTMTSLTGCTFKVYSTIQGALTAQDGSGAANVIFVCSGTYTENLTIPTSALSESLRIIGAGMESTILVPATAAGPILTTGSQSALMYEISHFTFEMSGMTADAKGISSGASASLMIHHCLFNLDGTIGIDVTVNPTALWVESCYFRGSGTGIDSTGGTVVGKMLVTHCQFSATVTIGIQFGTTGAVSAVTNCKFDSLTGVLITTSDAGLVTIADSVFSSCGVFGVGCSGLGFGGTVNNIQITGNVFYNNTVGCDFSGISASGTLKGLNINGNSFLAVGADIGVKFHADRNQSSLVGNNTFTGHTAGNEFSGQTLAQALTANNQIYHNETDSGTPIIDSGKGHATGAGVTPGTSSGANAAEPFVTIGNTAGLSAERALVGGSGIDLTDGGANGNATLDLANLTQKWDQSGAFDIVQRGGDLIIANGVGGSDFLLYSDNSASPSSLVGTWDAATGHIAIGTSISTSQIIALTDTHASAAARGIQLSLTSSTAGSGIVAGMNFIVTGTATTGTQLIAAGIYGAVGWTGAAAATTLAGSIVSGSSGTTGAISKWAAYYAASGGGWTTSPASTYVLYGDDQGGAGTPTAYGLYLPAQTGSAARSFIADSLVLGTDAAPPSGVKQSVTGGDLAILNDNLLRLYDTGSSNYIGIRADSARTTDLTYILPATDPTAGQILSASAPSGGVVTLSWAADATGAGGHTIQDDNLSMTSRANLSFQDGFVVTDDAGGDQTEIDLSYATPAFVLGTAAAAGSALTVVRSDATLLAFDATVPAAIGTAATGSATVAARRDHVHAIGTVKQSIVLTAAGGKPTTTAGCAAAQLVESVTNKIDYWVLDFDATTKEYAVWNVVMPDNWDASTLTYKVIWITTSSTSTHTAVFGLAALARGDAETMDTAYGTAIEVSDDATATANQVLHTAESAALTVGGTGAAGDWVAFRLYRDPANVSDDLNVDARVLAVRIEYGISQLSS